jgi:sugar/nucleoside kinase (ribokinase family)
VELSDVVFGSADDEIMPLADADTIEAGMRRICTGRRIVIARVGDRGALVTTPQESFHVPAFQVEVVDTLGAGDAFDGGFIAARLNEVSVKEAVRWGNAAAALKIGQSGARATPSKDELKKMLG